MPEPVDRIGRQTGHIMDGPTVVLLRGFETKVEPSRLVERGHAAGISLPFGPERQSVDVLDVGMRLDSGNFAGPKPAAAIAVISALKCLRLRIFL
jgi:hypothetical protein